MASIAHNEELLKNFLELVENFQAIFKQKRTYVPSIGLMLGEMMTVARHTITQILLTLGLSAGDWSAWYRLFSAGRIDFSLVSDILFPITLRHVVRDAVYVVAGDSTQRPRSGDKIEGAGWLHNPVSPPSSLAWEVSRSDGGCLVHPSSSPPARREADLHNRSRLGA
jgi:hypothetical protein